MKKAVHCLHASSANITLVEHLLPYNKIEFRHTVDTALLTLIRQHGSLNEQIELAYNTLMDILAMQPDLIFITCSNFIVLLDTIELDISVPILKIDEIWFDALKEVHQPIKLLFTNKETIEGTLARLKQHIATPLSIEVILIPELFDWYIAGDITRHNQVLLTYLDQLYDGISYIAVAQLSMSSSAEQFNLRQQGNILHPLTALKQRLSHLY